MCKNAYLVDDTVAPASDLLGDFVVVGEKVAEVGLDLVVLVSLGDFGLLGISGDHLLLILLILFFFGHSNIY